MKLDMRKILSGENDRIEIDYMLPDDSLPSFEDVVFPDGINVTGELTNTAGYMRLSLVCSVNYQTVCSRCLDPVNSTLRVDFEKTVCEEGGLQDTENDDYIEIKDGILDIDEAIAEDIILNFPQKHLCRMDCRGLCPKCGVNLNRTTCSCSTKEIDPRLAPLLNFLDKKQSEQE